MTILYIIIIIYLLTNMTLDLTTTTSNVSGVQTKHYLVLSE